MGLFAKTSKNAGWMAISFRADGICAAYIKRLPGELPAVERATFYPAAKPEAPVLEKLGKDLHAGRFQCTNMLAAGEYQLLSVDAPNVPPDELKTAIRWRLKDMLDFHVNDATIDVLDVPIDKDTPARNHTMYAVAARNQVIEQRQSVFEESGIPLSVIDIPEMAQRNISALLEPEGRGLAMLSFDADGGLLTVTYGGELYLARRLDVNLSQLQQGDAGQVHDRITLELQRSFDHFDRQYRFITLSKLVLSPIGSAGEPLREYLASNLYVPVEILNLDSVLNISRTPELKSASAQQRYFLTLGAALRLEEKVL